MIHQLIFAHSKPGMSEKEFQDYWVNIHAIRYASKIPQIKRYMIDSRIPFGPQPEDPLFHGVAEIWLENEEEQLASLQSKEFLEGARIDEPKWAAFWRTVVLDTTTHVLVEGPPMQGNSTMVKLFLMVKRKPGMPLEEFRKYSLETHAPKVINLPELQRYHQCHVRDTFYTVGEALLDSVSLLWFQDINALERAMKSSEFREQVLPDLSNFVDPKYIHTMVTSEKWIIGPENRELLLERGSQERSDIRLLQAVWNDHLDEVVELIRQGSSPNIRDASGLTPLMVASGHGNREMVKLLLDSGADVFTVEHRAGTSALHKACQGGNVDVVRLLVEAGAFIDWVAPTTGHTPLMDALWYKWPAIVEYLLQNGAGLNLYTHYGFSLMQHFEYELKVTDIGKEKLLEAERKIQQRLRSDEQKKELQRLMAAVASNDLETVKELVRAGVDVEERYPILNGFNDAHTPLLVAARDGRTEIVAVLLRAGADVNATEPIFGAAPLHKSVYNGHVEITRLLINHPGIDLNFQGATNGYTPLHDALWHGFDKCAKILIDAGARLDVRGHDGKTPEAIATEVFGQEHSITQLIREKLRRT